MRATLRDRLAHALTETPGLYYRLILVVGPPRCGKTRALHELQSSRGWPTLNVNLTLCEQLLELTRKRIRPAVPWVGLS